MARVAMVRVFTTAMVRVFTNHTHKQSKHQPCDAPHVSFVHKPSLLNFVFRYLNFIRQQGPIIINNMLMVNV